MAGVGFGRIAWWWWRLLRVLTVVLVGLVLLQGAALLTARRVVPDARGARTVDGRGA